MNKKGFTLVELLAVIVILAIIALIATPIVINVVNESREKANLRSIESYARAYETAYYQALLTNNTVDFNSETIVPQYSGTRITGCKMSLDKATNKITATDCQIGNDAKTKYKYDSENGASVQTTTSSDAGQDTGK